MAAASSSSCFCVFICMISISAFTLPTLSTADSPSLTPTIPSSYEHHCSSILPSSSPTHPITKHDLDSLLYLSTPYFTGGRQLLTRKNQAYIFDNGRKSLRLQLLPNCHETSSPGVFLIHAILHIRSPYIADFNHVRNDFTYGGTYSGRRQSQGSVRFSFTGLWSETSMKVCMVGSADLNFGDGRTLNISGVLKLKFVSQQSDVNISTSVISGSLASMSSKTDPEYFDPISMFNFPPLPQYNYSLLSEEISNFSNSGVAKSQSLGPRATIFCNDQLFWRSTFLEIDYTGNCTEPEHCSPLGNNVLPRYLYLMPIQCSTNEKKMRYLARFMNGSNLMGEDFSIESTLIAEGVWDDGTNQMHVGACRMLNPIDHFDDPLAECGIRLSFRYPSVLTIRNDSMVVGELWSKGSGKDQRYFRKIELTSDDMDYVAEFLGQKYQYTEMTRVLKSCPVENTAGEGKPYPDGKSNDMKFDAVVQNSVGEHLASAYATPVFVREELYQSSVIELNDMNEAKNGSKSSVLNISYKISIHPLWLEFNSSERISKLNMSLSSRDQVEISAEGVYNIETGQLCMVGCRRSWKEAGILTDCEILVKFQFPPLDNRKGSRINGTIVSTRRGEDPLHFESLTLSAAAFYTEMAEKSVWRMDLEIALVLISNTLFCIFVAFQIFHVKRNPEVISSISLMMVMILALGNMIPLVLNVEAVFSETHNKQTMFGWLEANEVAVRVITMVAFLLQIRLLQLVWTAKLHEGLDKGAWSPWSSEKKASLVTLSLHILGALFTLLFHWTTDSYDEGVQVRYGRRVHSVWGDLRSYAGLILDGFLLPQIILNAVGGSTEKALSNVFYIGSSTIRIVPHVYNQYRLQNYAGSNVNGTYYYADHVDELYSAVWDVVVPLGVVTMAVVVLLQQSCL